MAGTNWQPPASVQDGQVVDFEVLNSLIGNSNYLKEHAVSLQYTPLSGGMVNDNSSALKMKILGGIKKFDFGAKTYADVTIRYSSQTNPIVLVSVHSNGNANAYTYSASKSEAKCRVIKTSPGNDKNGYIFWIALTTVLV
jgi:hypothetical protein